MVNHPNFLKTKVIVITGFKLIFKAFNPIGMELAHRFGLPLVGLLNYENKMGECTTLLKTLKGCISVWVKITSSLRSKFDGLLALPKF